MVATDEQIQEKYLHLQLMAQTLKQMQDQIGMLDEQAGEVERVIAGLDEIGKAEINSNMLVPVAEGIFIKAQMKEKDSLLINVGQGVLVDKTIPETKDLLTKRNEEMIAQREEMALKLNDIMEHAQKLQEELNKMVQGQE